jgi:hypothetical protein
MWMTLIFPFTQTSLVFTWGEIFFVYYYFEYIDLVVWLLHWKSLQLKFENIFFFVGFRVWKFDVSHCGVDDQKPFVDYYIPNVVQTYKVLMEHQPKWHDYFPHLLFLFPKTRLDLLEKVWFKKLKWVKMHCAF